MNFSKLVLSAVFLAQSVHAATLTQSIETDGARVRVFAYGPGETTMTVKQTMQLSPSNSGSLASFNFNESFPGISQNFYAPASGARVWNRTDSNRSVYETFVGEKFAHDAMNVAGVLYNVGSDLFGAAFGRHTCNAWTTNGATIPANSTFSVTESYARQTRFGASVAIRAQGQNQGLVLACWTNVSNLPPFSIIGLAAGDYIEMVSR